MTAIRRGGHRKQGGIAAALAAITLSATAANAALRTGEAVTAPPAAATAAPRLHHWSAGQVRELIGLVEEARGHGLDPADYGLAALRSELEQSATLYRSTGSRQLDALARASAVALARAYRRRTPDEAGLATALRTNRLRAWIGAPATERS